jgi:hypothetical protein
MPDRSFFIGLFTGRIAARGAGFHKQRRERGNSNRDYGGMIGLRQRVRKR